jgi:uncharacterized protein
MKIEHEENGHKGAFFIANDGARVSEMTYVKAGDDKIIIDHTAVDDSLRGQGAGKQLLTAAVNYARENNIKILPLCPFAKSVFDKTPDYSDVLSN